MTLPPGSDQDAAKAIEAGKAAMERWTALAERSQAVVSEFIERQINSASGQEFQLVDYQAMAQVFASFNQKIAENPEKMVDAQMKLMAQSFELWQSTMKRMMGEEAAPVIEPEPGDRRFKDGAWREQIVFDHLKQSYLLTTRWIREIVSDIDDLDPATQGKLDFYTRQFLSAVSPSNFALTNPEVLRKAEESDGESLLSGLDHLLDDLERGHGRLKISMTDEDAFEVGVNVATTPGKVVFENDLIQLIQYQPTTGTVHKVPFLLVPPWINKFYILDLQPKNSLVHWLIEQGHTVFMTSWVNPGTEHAEKSFEDYMVEGPLAAMDAIAKATGEKQINVLGFCIGGMLLSATLAYLAAKGDKRVKSATLLASMIDLVDVGEVSVFVDEGQLERIEAHVSEHGYLEGHHMGDMFSMMRENDLIWSFVVNNYLLGREPMPFDLLYWNSDSTRLPAKMLTYYLRKFYIENGLMNPGSIVLDGVPVDVGKIKVPTFALATKDDHIAPWRSCFPVLQRFGGPVEFTLGGSGHIAGIVNPPSRTKYGYHTGPKTDGDADAWLAQARKHEGSWWPAWGAWLKRHAGKKVAARIPGTGALDIIEDAPGRYVRVKSDPS